MVSALRTTIADYMQSSKKLMPPRNKFCELKNISASYLLAHDYNRLVSRPHLNFLNKASNLQDCHCGFRHIVFRPFLILDLSDSKPTLRDGSF